MEISVPRDREGAFEPKIVRQRQKPLPGARSAVTSPTKAALKRVNMEIMSLDFIGKGQTRWTMRWRTAPNAFDITFDGRLSAVRQKPQQSKLRCSFGRPA
jgi:transposase-like protein